MRAITSGLLHNQTGHLERCFKKRPTDAGMSKDSECLEVIKRFLPGRFTKIPPTTALNHVCRKHLIAIAGKLAFRPQGGPATDCARSCYFVGSTGPI